MENKTKTKPEKIFLLPLEHVIETVGEQDVRNLKFNEIDGKEDRTIIYGEVSDRYTSTNRGIAKIWRSLTWEVDSKCPEYYSSGVEAWDIVIDAKGRIYDDTGSGDDFLINKILYKDEDSMVALVVNEWCDSPLKVFIDLEDMTVSHKGVEFYLYEESDNF